MGHCRIAAALAILLAVPCRVWAQTEAATLRGVVHDTSQAIVPAAGVTQTAASITLTWPICPWKGSESVFRAKG